MTRKYICWANLEPPVAIAFPVWINSSAMAAALIVGGIVTGNPTSAGLVTTDSDGHLITHGESESTGLHAKETDWQLF